MTEQPPPELGAAATTRRAARNTIVRAAAELIGKVASLALVAVLARTEGPVGVGIFVLALAWCELATTPIDMGLDRYLLRRVAADRAVLDALFANVVVVKLARAVPVIAISWLMVWVTGQGDVTQDAIYLLTAALLLESLRYTVFGVFNAFERGELVATALLTHRLLAAGLGIAALALGYGVVAVAATYALSAAAALAVAVALLARRIRWPALLLPAAERRELRRQSLPFATQDLFSIGIARIDTIVLSAFATKAVIGLYGAAYRLLEATLFISSALTGAFSAMFTYLSADSDPPIRAVFERALKATLAPLVPCAVVLAVLAEPVLRLLFGSGFEQAAGPLRVLAAVVVLLGVVRIASALVVSRRDPRVLLRLFGIAMVLNLALNLLLIGPLEATGAALAMLGTELLLLVGAMRAAAVAVGRPRLTVTLAAPVAAGAGMAAAMWPLRDELVAALPVGAIVYAGVFLAIERLVNPEDLRFLADLLRRRLPAKAAA